MDPQPLPLLHCLVRMKQTSTNVFLQFTKNVEVTKGMIWAVGRILKYFPAQSVKLIAHQTGIMGRALSCKRIIPSDNISGRFDFMSCSSTLSHQETNHTSLHFFVLPPFPMLDEHTLHYTHLQSNCVDLCVFTMHVSYRTDGSFYT